MSAAAEDRPIFLVGFMAAGKSSVARALAARLGWSAVDIDALVAGREGRPIRQIFDESGEPHFRRAEWEALCSLDGRTRIVVATGGGLFLGFRARRWMIDRGRTVWLDVPLEVARRRAGRRRKDRPLWDAADPLAQREMYERRRAAYALARVRIDAGSGTAEGVAGAILDRLGGARDQNFR